MLLELVLEGRRDGDAVEHRVDGHAGEPLLFLEGNPELVVRVEQLRVDLVEALELLLRLRRRVVVHVLVVDLRVVDLRPGGLVPFLEHLQESPIGLEPPLEEPFRLFLLRGDQPHGVFAETLGHELGLDIGLEAVFVFAVGELFECGGFGHGVSRTLSEPGL